MLIFVNTLIKIAKEVYYTFGSKMKKEKDSVHIIPVVEITQNINYNLMMKRYTIIVLIIVLHLFGITNICINNV